MAWTAPRTYTDGEVITAAILNVDLRDNMLAVSSHAHSGAAGDGDDELSGVDSIIFDAIATPGSAPGASLLHFYHKTGTSGLFFRAGASGVETQVSDSSHTHTLSEVDPESATNYFAAGSAAFNDAIADVFSPDENDQQPVTVDFTAPAMIVGVAWFAYDDPDSGNWEMELRIGGAVIETADEGIDKGVTILVGSEFQTSGSSIEVRSEMTYEGGSGDHHALHGVGAMAVEF